MRAFPTLAGAEVTHWAVRQLGLSGPSELSQLADKVAPGADGLCFLPYLSPAGERVPFLNTGARGSLLGLSFEHGREHIARAVLEGLSLVIRDCLQASQEAPFPLRVCGLCGGGEEPVLVSVARGPARQLSHPAGERRGGFRHGGSGGGGRTQGGGQSPARWCAFAR